MMNRLSPFAVRVYDAVRRIPKGKASTYSAIAAAAGSPRAARAVGNLLHSNPFPGIVPCHRVVAADGSLSGAFAFGGEGRQQELLEAEGVTVENGKVKREFIVWNLD